MEVSCLPGIFHVHVGVLDHDHVGVSTRDASLLPIFLFTSTAVASQRFTIVVVDVTVNGLKYMQLPICPLNLAHQRCMHQGIVARQDGLFSFALLADKTE